MAERGQAEVLGYVLVFSLVVLTVAMVTISGEVGLAELRDSQRAANVEAGFSTLANNVDDVLRGAVPSRATELDLSGGTVSMGAPITVTVSASNETGDLFNHSRSLRPIVYETPGGTRLVYATGAVTIQDDGGVAMLREPRMLLSSDRSIVPIADTVFDSQQLQGGADLVDRESRVLVRTERRTHETVASTNAPVTLTITVDSPRASAWESYLESAIDPGSDDCALGGGSVSCTYETDRAAVVLSRVAVSFE